MARRGLGREANSGGDEEHPFLDPLRVIQLQQAHGGATAGCERLDTAVLKTKVFCPMIAARVEERHNGPTLCVDGGQIAPFEAIAESAGQGEIAGIRGPAVFLAITWSISCAAKVIDSGIRQYSQQSRARSRTVRRNSAGMCVRLMACHST
jgi:hypothetical protein